MKDGDGSNEFKLWQHLFAGVVFAIIIVASVSAGILIDRHWEISPWGMLICLFLGFGVGLWNLIREFWFVFKK